MTGRARAWQRALLAIGGVIALLALLHRHEARAAIRDADDAWHLTCGRIIVETRAVPDADPLCFTSEGAAWINLNWLAQVLAYRVYLAWGWGGAIALGAALHALTLLFTALHLRARGARPLAALAALAVVFLALLTVRGVRPQSFTFALLALCAWLLARPDPERRLEPAVAGALALALCLWTHLHGGFVFGYALVGLEAAGAVVASRRAGGPWLPRRAGLLAAVLAAGATSFLLHPHGPRALAYAVGYKRALGAQLGTIVELSPLAPGAGEARWVVPLVVAGALLVWRGARPRPADALVLVVFLLETLRVRRVAVPLALLGAPALAAWANGVAPARGRVAAALGAAARGLDDRLELLWRAVPWALGLATAAWLLLAAPRLTPPGAPGQLSPALDARVLPVEAALYLKRSGVPGRIFNEYSAGGVLGWVLYPERRLFIDGRGDLHARTGAYGECLQVTHLRPGWRDVLSRWDVALVVFPRGLPLVAALRGDGWTTLHEDAAFVVLRRPG